MEICWATGPGQDRQSTVMAGKRHVIPKGYQPVQHRASTLAKLGWFGVSTALESKRELRGFTSSDLACRSGFLGSASLLLSAFALASPFPGCLNTA
jgi:hypothetical protein